MSKIYLLIINEDGDVVKLTQLTKDEYKAACDGYVTIVDITNPTEPLLLTFYDEDDYTWNTIK